jgi:hypothetical protein
MLMATLLVPGRFEHIAAATARADGGKWHRRDENARGEFRPDQRSATEESGVAPSMTEVGSGRIRTAVIGTGYFGAAHVDALSRLGDVEGLRTAIELPQCVVIREDKPKMW